MKTHLRMLAYISLVFFCFFMFAWRMQPETGIPLSELEFVTYDNVLYSPEELHQLTEKQKADGHVGWDYDYYDTEFSRVRTNQMILKLVPGETYGLYTEQLTYAAKLWIDGKLMAQLGEVSDSPEGFIPRTGSVVVYFTAGEETEIVMQRCNFNHAKWNAVRFYYGPQDVITRQVQTKNFREIAYLGFLSALGIINLGMFAGMTERRRFLWFSAACFCTMIHQSLQDPKVIMQVFPSLNWNISYRLEGTSLFLMVIFLFLFMRDCFGNTPCRWADPFFIGLFSFHTFLSLFIPTILYTRYTVQMEVFFAGCCALYCMLILVRIILNRKKLMAAQYYYIAGVLVFLLTTLFTILRIGPAHVNQIRIGMILFELITTLSLALEFTDVRRAYQISRQQEAQLRQMNASMEQTQELQENFMAIMNHEMRTPLTVIAGYAALSVENLRNQDPPDEEMIRNLQLIKQEALRLGRIVEQSDEGARTMAGNGQIEEVPVQELFEAARNFCQPICEKRNNKIQMECPASLTVPCVRDSVLQLLYNLIINASRHTNHGLIRLAGIKKDGKIILKVADNGEGMDEDTRQHAFERGYSKDGGHGLGLALCQEIAKHHNGNIRIEENDPYGTVVILTLPAEQADGKQ